MKIRKIRNINEALKIIENGGSLYVEGKVLDKIKKAIGRKVKNVINSKNKKLKVEQKIEKITKNIQSIIKEKYNDEYKLDVKHFYLRTKSVKPDWIYYYTTFIITYQPKNKDDLHEITVQSESNIISDIDEIITKYYTDIGIKQFDFKHNIMFGDTKICENQYQIAIVIEDVTFDLIGAAFGQKEQSQFNLN